MSMDEIIQLAGVAAHTIPPEDIDTLKSMHLSEAQLNLQSLFKGADWALGRQERRSYIDDEVRYRVEFAAAENGNGQAKLFQVLPILIILFSKFTDRLMIGNFHVLRLSKRG